MLEAEEEGGKGRFLPPSGGAPTPPTFRVRARFAAAAAVPAAAASPRRTRPLVLLQASQTGQAGQAAGWGRKQAAQLR